MSEGPNDYRNFQLNRALIKRMLELCADGQLNLPWSVQGFGFIRTYLDPHKRWRLNVWHSGLRVPNVSTIHDHPWDFTSVVIAGRLTNVVYRIVARNSGEIYPIDFDTHEFHRIKTGEEGGKVSESKLCRLVADKPVIYTRGETYTQLGHWIHETSYTDGTVTINDRSPPTPEYTARVFWPKGQQWVDAKPRIATQAEVCLACNTAIREFDV